MFVKPKSLYNNRLFSKAIAKLGTAFAVVLDHHHHKQTCRSSLHSNCAVKSQKTKKKPIPHHLATFVALDPVSKEAEGCQLIGYQCGTPVNFVQDFARTSQRAPL